MLNMAIITGFLSKTKDRFHEYNAPLELDEKFALMADIEGYDGVEIVYPYEVSDPAATRQVLDKYGLKAAAVNVNVKAEPEFRNGGLTSHLPEVREKAVRFIKEAKDFAQAVGADKVTCCPLGDGYEFAFQYDYAQTWKYLVEAFGADVLRYYFMREVGFGQDGDFSHRNLLNRYNGELANGLGNLMNRIVEGAGITAFPMDPANAPEEEIDLEREYEGQRWPVRWRQTPP